jgi:hypothetical protein
MLGAPHPRFKVLLVRASGEGVRSRRPRLEAAQRSTNARVYGHVHQKTRQRYAELVAAGRAVCARCGLALDPLEPWDLDHRDDRKGCAASGVTGRFAAHDA